MQSMARSFHCLSLEWCGQAEAASWEVLWCCIKTDGIAVSCWVATPGIYYYKNLTWINKYDLWKWGKVSGLSWFEARQGHCPQKWIPSPLLCRVVEIWFVIYNERERGTKREALYPKREKKKKGLKAWDMRENWAREDDLCNPEYKLSWFVYSLLAQLWVMSGF